MSEIVILIGNCKVGKTSYLNYVIGRSNNHKNVTPTIGVQYAPVTIRAGGDEIRVNIWDTCKTMTTLAGAQKYKSITSSYYRKCQGAFIMFDLTDRKSFIDLKNWIEELKKVISTRLQKILLANKYDLVESGQKERQVTEEQITDFCLEHQIEVKYTSAFTGEMVKESFNWFIEKIHEDRLSRKDNIKSESSEFDKNNITIENTKPNKSNDDHLNCSKCC